MSAARAAREAVVWKHFESEAAQEFGVTLTTLAHRPRYEVIPTGQVFEGAQEVMTYYRTTRAAFPDQRHDNVRLYHTDQAVIAEFDLLGTHEGGLYGFPPPARASAARWWHSSSMAMKSCVNASTSTC
jgi:SnoaL-like domain